MKKYGRKWRRLQYIRSKNKLNSGGILFGIVKGTINNGESMVDHAWSLIRKQEKNYKMSLEIQDLEFGWVNDDFIRELITLKFSFKKA